jgi:hypothetical protein
MEQSNACQISYGPLGGVSFRKVIGLRQFMDELREREYGGMRKKHECHDGALHLSICVGTGNGIAWIRRVGLSHEESPLLVVRRPVRVDARRVAAIWSR